MCLAADGTYQKSARVGDCGRKDDTSQVYSLIRLDPADLAEHCHGIGVGAENRSRKISVLLHECIHAFIFLYTCEKGCPHDNCAANRSYLVGHSGHGLAFLQIATHIEAYHEVLTQIGVTLGIPHGVCTAATTSSEYMGIRPNDFVHCHQSWHVWLKQYYEQALAKKGRDEDDMGLPDILKTMKGFSLEEFSSPER
ncbi:hypothetical protein Slin14017_G021890 [Septoria linicola]|nr:hypothetical protein Slin14017_G021890 [Septoria linicola]